jgi:DNA-binding response OmpR family regulator
LDIQLAFLKVHGPDAQDFSVELTKDRLTIGRLRDFNDVALEPDPQQLVTRKAHCAVEWDMDGWWAVDNGSVNRTFVRRGQATEVVNGRAPITDGDVICILGRITDEGTPVYWELTFQDPMKTQPAQGVLRVAFLEYDWVQAKLFRVAGSNREEICNLRPQEHKLVRYMDQRNRANGNVPVMCTYDEIIAAIWGDEPFHTEGEVTRLVWDLRQKVELDPKEPQLLQTVRGLGYRLVTYPLAE